MKVGPIKREDFSVAGEGENLRAGPVLTRTYERKKVEDFGVGARALFLASYRT